MVHLTENKKLQERHGYVCHEVFLPRNIFQIQPAAKEGPMLPFSFQPFPSWWQQIPYYLVSPQLLSQPPSVRLIPEGR